MTPRRIDEVTPGYYRYKRRRDGPWLPAVVSVENGMIYVVEADQWLRVGIAFAAYEDLLVNAVVAGEAFDDNLIRVLWFGEKISQADYQHMLDMLVWARANQPDHPMLHPDQPIRLSTVKVSSIF